MINKILNELKTEYQLSDKMLKTYEFESRGNRIFIMTKQVKEFEKIRAVRKGMLLAEKLGSKIKVSDNAIQVLKSIPL